jgi:hypothetical protein
MPTTTCATCGETYGAELASCPGCSTVNPSQDEDSSQPSASEDIGEALLSIPFGVLMLLVAALFHVTPRHLNQTLMVCLGLGGTCQALFWKGAALNTLTVRQRNLFDFSKLLIFSSLICRFLLTVYLRSKS